MKTVRGDEVQVGLTAIAAGAGSNNSTLAFGFCRVHVLIGGWLPYMSLVQLLTTLLQDAACQCQCVGLLRAISRFSIHLLCVTSSLSICTSMVILVSFLCLGVRFVLSYFPTDQCPFSQKSTRHGHRIKGPVHLCVGT
jgi:hypothetical protein